MHDAWVKEWTTLQHQHEAYERSGLWIKLLAVALVAAAAWLALSPPLLAVLLLVLWAQEAIMKTWQARLGARLQVVEAALGDPASSAAQPCQLHTQWQGQRPSAAGLLLEYAQSALRPTVAFPYAVLLLLAIGL